ncbi:hypothetical protein [Acinetobacter sp. ANC 3832]|uniref:hypothetical protein n=1 Tax=Acinetobacter sp. ANC 3832 TaxID=1977874 RepID=UPI000A35463F|nr:hypothetical protein [Acinetobacter sp. ANC 3832]OTG87216.1 hypothetical protein B9T35_17830 [Acinetobacter sp. ANC 3832]
MPKYIAKQSIGQFMPGEEIKGLDADRIQALLVSGAIEEYKEPEKPKTDDSDARLAELEAEVAELKVNEEILIAGKDKAEAEVVELKVKIADLEKASGTEKKTTAKPANEPK